VVIRLTGSEAEHGLPLANLAAFVESFRGALRDFDRQRQAERTGRGGRPSGREELVTSFRLVGFEPGSAIMTLEPFAPSDADDQQVLTEVDLLALQNLETFLDSLDQPEERFDAAVADAVEKARRSLGPDGRIEIKSPHHRKRVVIDESKVHSLERRVRRYSTRQQRVAGRLHMIDVEPDQVRIRTADNVDWICTYPEDLELKVLSLVTKRVWALGIGALQSASRGSLLIHQIEEIGEPEQNALFTMERIPIEDILADQGIQGPQGGIPLVPEDVSDDELDAFLEQLVK
jgi:hypothetical protein